MSTMDYFKEFYNSLDTIDLVLLWVGVFSFIVLIILSINLYFKNKKLMSLLKSTKEEQQKEVVNIKEEKKEKQVEVIEKKEETKEEFIKEEIKEGPYSKNILRDMSTRHQTSPINIVNEKAKEHSNIAYTEEITKKIEQELKPQTIELTDYEKQQEEDAIISYKELLSNNKDKIYNINDEEETTDFIKELKSFRSSL